MHFPKKKRDGFPELSKIGTDDNNSNRKYEDGALPRAPEPAPPKIEPVKERVFDVVEQSAWFQGGAEALQSYLDKNLKIPRAAKKKANRRPVVVSFVVEKDGSITNATIVESVHPSMDKEALRVVTEMPKWNPYRKNGEVDRSTFQLPISFQRKKK